MHEVLVNRLGGLSLPRESVARLTDRPDMTLDVYRGRKTTMQQQQQQSSLQINISAKVKSLIGGEMICFTMYVSMICPQTVRSFEKMQSL